MVTTRVRVSLDHLLGSTATQNRHKHSTHKAASTSTSTSTCGDAERRD